MIRPATEQDYRERIVRTLVFIQGHLDEELELESVARVAAFSPFHFHRIFRGLVGNRWGARAAAAFGARRGRPEAVGRARRTNRIAGGIRDARIVYEGIYEYVRRIADEV